ncbi:hypothetical protein M0R45_024879 [Rubus argutus]|uniref:Tify domain-containing protein n=1 Tax=Rubus argutus TaxID=59490 RepID=A0AAW1WU11_RUBAR
MGDDGLIGKSRDIKGSSENESDGIVTSDDPDYSSRNITRQSPLLIRHGEASSCGILVRKPGSRAQNRATYVLPIYYQRLKRKKRDPTSMESHAGSSSGNPSEEEVIDSSTILARLIDLQVIQENSKVLYMNESKEPVLEGWIRRDRILCNCCGQVITVWDFEFHAKSSLENPYQQIFVMDNNNTLLE